ncbi:hypothetical protein F4775DRAFT_559054 [Biscogniauxia sp. FL1348]|nr:hypothetical protein F4775DRAFT_559054 [Biscogniauxia sp. FL1348]
MIHETGPVPSGFGFFAAAVVTILQKDRRSPSSFLFYLFIFLLRRCYLVCYVVSCNPGGLICSTLHYYLPS